MSSAWRSLAVVALDEITEARLPQDIGRCGLRGFLLQRQIHPLRPFCSGWPGLMLDRALE
jgi:hypothetical protein